MAIMKVSMRLCNVILLSHVFTENKSLILCSWLADKDARDP